MHKLLKTVTFQRADPQALPDSARAASRMGHGKCMTGRALNAEARLLRSVSAAS
ncbi:hypothetical protein GGQ68_003405 [Sagittula marina]|uniref:Uncharacterized protein n=1 Tax=Sagittula marina TaxID=943940 RepID=A0A7W6GT37_9RHOB|nr:hypothetical protein [Sagittula marina]MBB3987061.1 hypothetical protein [Sagittula marina]